MPNLLEQCQAILQELDYIARAYPIGGDPSYALRESLREDLQNSQILSVPYVNRCQRQLETARTEYSKGNHKLVHDPALQEELCRNFHFLYAQIKHLNTPDSKKCLRNITSYYKTADSLEHLLAARSNLPPIVSYKPSEEKKVRSGCFNFAYTDHKQKQHRRSVATSIEYDNRIEEACRKLLAPCLTMYQFTLDHPINTALAIRQPLTPELMF